MKIVFCAERPVTALLNFRVRAQRTHRARAAVAKASSPFVVFVLFMVHCIWFRRAAGKATGSPGDFWPEEARILRYQRPMPLIGALLKTHFAIGYLRFTADFRSRRAGQQGRWK
jgi:hypothetical protein